MSTRNKPQEAETEKKAEEKKEVNPNSSAGTQKPEVPAGRYSDLLKRASYINTFRRAGSSLAQERCIVKGNGNYLDTGYEVPMVMVFDWIPTFGVAKSGTDPVNMATLEEYSFVRHMNSGSRNYEGVDLMLYYLGMGSAFDYYAYLYRAYALINAYKTLNVYYPKRILEGMRFDFNDLVVNQPNLLFYLKSYRAKLNQFCLPRKLQMFKDHFDLNSKIYTDGDTIQAQTYIFNQSIFYTFKKIDQANGLSPVRLFDGSPITFARIVEVGNEILNSMLASEDINIISGDVMKAYGAEGLMIVDDVDSAAEVAIEKSDAILRSIMNASIVPIDDSTVRIYDNRDGTLKNDMSWATASASSVTGTVNYYNFINVEPSVEEIIDSTRFKVVVKAQYSTGMPLTSGQITACGTEIIESARILGIQPMKYSTNVMVANVEGSGVDSSVPHWDGYTTNRGAGSLATYGINIPQFSRIRGVVGNVEEGSTPGAFNTTIWNSLFADINDALAACHLISKFDWHFPTYLVGYVGTVDGSNDKYDPDYSAGVEPGFASVVPMLRDTQNLVSVDEDTISQLHEAKLLYQFFG